MQIYLGNIQINNLILIIIFSNLNHDNYQMVRSNVIDMVLATELGKHFEHVNKFISSTRVSDEPSDGSGRSPRVSTISLNNQQSENDDAELRTLVKRVLIKVAGMFFIFPTLLFPTLF